MKRTLIKSRVFKAELEYNSSIYKFEVILILTFNSLEFSNISLIRFNNIFEFSDILFPNFSGKVPVTFLSKNNME